MRRRHKLRGQWFWAVFLKGRGGGRLALILSLCEGGVEINFCLMRGGIWLSFGVYFTHFPTPSPPLPGNYCTVPKGQPNRTVNMVYKRDCPIPGCGAKYLVTLANLFAYVHQLDYLYITAKREFQQAKLQPKGKVVVYESKADNSRKIMVLLLASSTDTRNGVRTVKITKKWRVFWSKNWKNNYKGQAKPQETKEVELLAEAIGILDL